MIEILKKRQKVFAWGYEDMPGIDREITEHRIPTYPHMAPWFNLKFVLENIPLSYHYFLCIFLFQFICIRNRTESTGQFGSVGSGSA